MKRRIAVAATWWSASALAAVLSFSAGAAPPPHKTMHVFGDSLADMGNVSHLTQSQVPPRNLYFQGRFSNGPVAPEVLWWLLSQNPPGSKKALKPALSTAKLTGDDSVNFAFGGAGTGETTLTPGQFFVPGLKGQVAMFLKMAKANGLAKKALYLIVVGANDYLFAPPDVIPNPAAVVQNITQSIQQLYAAGARDFMVLNLPDLGEAPLVTDETVAASLSALSAQHNALLADALTQLGQKLAGATITPVDLGPLLQSPSPDAALDDLLFEGASLCLFAPVPECAGGVADFNNAEGYFFWDALHPTTAVHQFLGRFLFDVLQQ